jgi:lysyl-tRNA synthetase class 2
MLEEEIIRRAKADRLRAEGVDPYPSKVNRTDEIGKVLEQFTARVANLKNTATLVGRLRSIRAHGGAAFADLADASGQIQLYFKSDVVGEEQFKLFMDCVDHADFIEATGELFLTKRGQQSLLVKSWRLLAKALLPLPEKWHGLSDVETRYRHRHLDLLANPEVFETFRKRSLIVQKIREILSR